MGSSEHFSRVIKGWQALLDLRGSRSTLPFVIDKDGLAVRFLLSLPRGELYLLTALLLFRGYDVEIVRADGTAAGCRRPTWDVLRPQGGYRLKAVLRRLRCAWKYVWLLQSSSFPGYGGPIEKLMVAHYLWAVIAIQSTAPNEDMVDEVVLNGDFSPAEAAMYATAPTNARLVALIPVFARLDDSYYLRLSSVVTEFRLQRSTDYLPECLPASMRGKTTTYRMPEMLRAKTDTITIFIILTTFKGHEERRISTAIGAIKTIKEKYGDGNTYKLRPHPYEFDRFKDSPDIQAAGAEVTMDMTALAEADLCIVAGTSLVFDLVLAGKPFIFVPELDPYFPTNTYDIFQDSNIPSCAHVSDLPAYDELIAFYSANNRWGRICQWILGDCNPTLKNASIS